MTDGSVYYYRIKEKDEYHNSHTHYVKSPIEIPIGRLHGDLKIKPFHQDDITVLTGDQSSLRELTGGRYDLRSDEVLSLTDTIFKITILNKTLGFIRGTAEQVMKRYENTPFLDEKNHFSVTCVDFRAFSLSEAQEIVELFKVVNDTPQILDNLHKQCQSIENEIKEAWKEVGNAETKLREILLNL